MLEPSDRGVRDLDGGTFQRNSDPGAYASLSQDEASLLPLHFCSHMCSPCNNLAKWKEIVYDWVAPQDWSLLIISVAMHIMSAAVGQVS